MNTNVRDFNDEALYLIYIYAMEVVKLETRSCGWNMLSFLMLNILRLYNLVSELLDLNTWGSREVIVFSQWVHFTKLGDVPCIR